MLRLVARIQTDPGSGSSLEALAHESGLSPTHLQRVFSRMVGESPKRIAPRIALERAAARLLTGSESVLSVALSSGFDSHEGFARAFRRRFGRSPSDYRARRLPARSKPGCRSTGARQRAMRGRYT